jgi:hypothetical protein
MPDVDEEKTTSQLLYALFNEPKVAAADGSKPSSTHDLFSMTQNCIGACAALGLHLGCSGDVSDAGLNIFVLCAGKGTFGCVRVAEVPSVKSEDGGAVFIAIKIMKKTELVRLKQARRASRPACGASEAVQLCVEGCSTLL